MNKKYDFGIVIGRFQPFHLAHQALIKHSLTLAEKVIVVLGSARSASDVKNPFTPAMREEIVRACFPKDGNRLIFRAVRDYPYNDHVWTAEVQNVVDEVIEDNFESEGSQTSEEFKKYEDFNRGNQRLVSSDKKEFPKYENLSELKRSIRPKRNQTSDDRIKILTYEITKLVTDDAQNNVILLRDFINEKEELSNHSKLLEPTVANGKINFRTTSGKLWTLDLTYENEQASKIIFGEKIRELLVSSDSEKKTFPKIAIVGFFKDRSSYYLNLFPQWSYEDFYTSDKKLLAINATDIRAGLFENDADDWKKLLPVQASTALEVFRQTETYENLKREYAYLKKYKEDTRFVGVPFEPTFITTDAVVVQSGHLLVIRRGHQPGKGLLALPGGFLASGLTLEDNAIKELKEETQIKVPAQVLRGSIKSSHVFDYPERSNRGRTVTFAYLIELEPNLKEGLPRVRGGDDAARAFWLPLSAIGEKEEEFFEDHVHIVKYFLGM